MLPALDCTPSEVVCCPTFYDIGYHILTRAFAAVQPCSAPSPCETVWHTYVTIGDGDDGVMDALSVALMGVGPSSKSQDTGRLSPIMQIKADYRVRLLDSGWPMVHEDDGVIVQPDPAEQNALARHSYARGEALYRGLLNDVVNGTILPTGMACSATTIDRLLPLKPAGGTVGWYTTISLTLALGSTP